MYEHALVVGKFAPLHRGHQRLIEAAQAAAGSVTAVVWSNPDFPDMPNEVRAEWIRRLYPTVHVIVASDGPPNDEPDLVHRDYTAALLRRSGVRVDVVLTAEPYGPGFAAHLGVEHIALDRTAMPEWSGTTVRSQIDAYRHLLDPIVYSHFVQRVVIMGAESTGKSTLTRRMAEVVNTVHVDEYGREHYELRGGDLDLDDYVEIAEVHRAREDEAILRANRYLFVDTNAITTMFFSHYYNRGSRPELRRLADECRDRYPHVIVCDDDIPFEQDGWRDNAAWRSRMQGMVLHDLAVRGIEYTVVSGTLAQRVEQVIAVLDGRAASSLVEHRSSGPLP